MIVDDGAALQHQTVVELEHGCSRFQAQRAGDGLIESAALEAQQFDRGHLAQPIAALDVEELEQETVGAVGGNESARPCRRTRMCSATSSSTAWRKVPTEMPKARASTASLGRASPGGTAPLSICCSSARLALRYGGMPPASGAMALNAGLAGGMARDCDDPPGTCKSYG